MVCYEVSIDNVAFMCFLFLYRKHLKQVTFLSSQKYEDIYVILCPYHNEDTSVLSKFAL